MLLVYNQHKNIFKLTLVVMFQEIASCECLKGFEGSLCEINVDDCENVKCKNGGNCVDLINTYSCNCPNGFSGMLD